MFRTKSSDGKVHQNSGVRAPVDYDSNAARANPEKKEYYYGVLQEIWVLDYHTTSYTVFKCDWVHNTRGVTKDKLGYTMVNLKILGDKHDPFILASHAEQVFYVKDQESKNKSIVFPTPPKNYKDIYEAEEYSTLVYSETQNVLPSYTDDEMSMESANDYLRPEAKKKRR